MVMLAAAVLAVFLAGCNPEDFAKTMRTPKPAMNSSATKPASLPPHITGTIAEFAALRGGSEMLVQGYGLVVGLGTNGSSEVPEHLREYFNQYMLKRKVFSPISGTGDVSPRMILSDMDTAVVDVWGKIPLGAPAETRFDVYVSALPQTQTRSLDGGVLMPTELHLAVMGAELASKRSRVWAEGAGAVFVNPFLDSSNSNDLPKLREGKVIGGGKTIEGRGIRIQLYRGDYQICNLIQRRINECFPNEKVATAKDDSSVDIVIPREFSQDYEHFLQIIMHLPLKQASAAWETQAREVAAVMEGSGANHDELALVWEAMGRQVLPVVQKMYSASNQYAAYYAARTGIRLGDPRAVELVAKFARAQGSPFQTKAVEELGLYGRTTGARAALYSLLDDDNELVRIAAYEALRRQGDKSRITRMAFKNQFDVDVVDSSKGSVIYALQSQQPRLVLFGKGIPIRRPVFFNSPDDLVTVNARAADAKLQVFRKISRTGQYSPSFETGANVQDLVKVLATAPEMERGGRMFGLGLTYGQVVGVLQRMCKSGDIPAKFRLQALPEVQKMIKGAATVGRPDLPGS
jgi:flagellar basal body P-ring protein FlgI